MTQSKDNENNFELVTITGADTININDCAVSTVDISGITLSTPTYSSNTDTFTMEVGDNTFTMSDPLDINIDNLTNITFDKIVFEDHMPDPNRIKKMCQHYPALDKAYENFKTIYKMVNQDYKGNYEDDEDVPF